MCCNSLLEKTQSRVHVHVLYVSVLYTSICVYTGGIGHIVLYCVAFGYQFCC